jgi:5-formyltetrahydrofolate cyclo-ligase
MAAPHPSSSRDLVEAKREARGRALAARAGCDPAWGARLTEHVLRDNPPPAGAVVSGFWPLGGEIDIRPLLLALLERGHEIVLPVTPPRGQPLGFRLWRPGDPMAPEKFGTVRPTGAERAPDFLLVPLLAFDRRGRRLGYGAGYYDRTLTALPAAGRLGCAYAAQEMDEVPAGPHDVRLPAVATERGIIRCVIEG